MAKLPENFVKPPAASRLTTGKTAAPKTSRRLRKADVEAEAARHVHDVLVHLTPDEYQALAAACDALAAVGETVTIEDMIKQVIARWITSTRAMNTPATVEVTPEPVISQLRRLALASERSRAPVRREAASEPYKMPVRRWRAIGDTLRRWSRIWR